MNIILSISLSAVLEEVAQTTGYTGSKMDADANAYERIATVDEDHSELMRFWNESRSEVAKAFIRMLVSEGMSDSDTYQLSLRVPSSFDTSLLPSMRVGLFSYFVQSITARWFGYTNKGESDIYVARSLTLLDELRRKAFYKRVPSSGGGDDDGGGDKPRTLTHADISDWDTATSGFATQQWVQDAWDAYDQEYHMSTAYDTATAAASAASAAQTAAVSASSVAATAYDTAAAAATAASAADGKAVAAQSAAAAAASSVSQLRNLLSEKADQSAVDALEQAKVDKEPDKGLSTNDYTTAEKTKLSGIAAGAEANVQSDWNATSGAAYIKNKPTIPSNVSDLTNDSGFVNTSGVNSIINSRMEVISRSAYNALTPTQQASKIYFIYEDTNSSAS